MHGDVELTTVVVHAEGCAMETDDVSETKNDGEVLEAVGVHDDAGVITTLGASVEGGVGNLERADVELLVDLVGEGSINDDTVDVVGLGLGEAGLTKFVVVVLLTLSLNGFRLGRGLCLLGGSGTGH